MSDEQQASEVVEDNNNAVAAPTLEPIFLTNNEFSKLLNVLLIDTKFFIATELKEKPKYEGDTTVYHINILVQNPIINIKSDLLQLLAKYSNNVQFINNDDLKGYHVVGVEVYVKDAK